MPGFRRYTIYPEVYASQVKLNNYDMTWAPCLSLCLWVHYIDLVHLAVRASQVKLNF